jgi:hypothetical protein
MIRSTIAAAFLLLAFTPSLAAHGHADGIVIVSVSPGGPAAAAGLQVDDHVIQLDGRAVSNMANLRAVMNEHSPGDAVPLVVERGGETVHLTLTFGERDGGGVSLGVSLSTSPGNDLGTEAERDAGRLECLAWIDQTYSITSMMREMKIDQSETYETIRECVGRDAMRMAPSDAVRYCDNVFKVHCSGVELLADIGEAQVQQCEQQLNESLGLKLDQYRGWKSCGQNKVFDRYSMDGESSDSESCKAALLDECGTSIDAAIATGETSPDQREFMDCCSLGAAAAKHRDADSCNMIDDGFTRGPCHDRSVCVNRYTSEWLSCAVLR